MAPDVDGPEALPDLHHEEAPDQLVVPGRVLELVRVVAVRPRVPGALVQPGPAAGGRGDREEEEDDEEEEEEESLHGGWEARQE